MTETKLIPANNLQQQNNHRRNTSNGHTITTSDVSGHNVNVAQHPIPVVIKKPTILDSIYKILRVKRENEKTETECTPREIGTFIVIGILFVLFLSSIIGFFVMWFTEVYNNTFMSQLVLTNTSEATKLWMRPPLSTHLKVHIFNYTNIDRFLDGLDDKIMIQDLGPYTYEENSTKVNVVFNDNYTITYQDRRLYQFVPEASVGRQYDQLVVPNVPLITAAAAMRHESPFFKIPKKIAISATNSKPFIHVAADSLLWGYADALVDLSKRFNDQRFEQFGLLINRNGTSKDKFQIYSGEDDIRKLAVLAQFNGKRSMNMWSTKDCNSIDGTEGSQFPPYLMDKKQLLNVFIPSLCRKLPLAFDSEVNVFDGVPAWRYKTPLNVFSHPDTNPDNQCYCHIQSGVCPLSGVFNATLCYEAPIFISFPHFLAGNPLLSKHLVGMKPIPEKHQTFADIHPRLAFPIDGASRIQINIQVHREDFLGKLNRLDEGSLLPIMWLEVSSGEISDDLRALIYHSTFSANAIQLTLKYGTLLICVTSFAILVVACYYRKRSKENNEERGRDYDIPSKIPMITVNNES